VEFLVNKLLKIFRKVCQVNTSVPCLCINSVDVTYTTRNTLLSSDRHRVLELVRCSIGLLLKRCPDILPPGHNSPFPLFQSVITPVIVALVVIIERRYRLQLPYKRTII